MSPPQSEKTGECLFCQLFAGEIEARKVYEDNDVVGVLDLYPRFAMGQCLVIPRRHVAQFYELEDEELVRLFLAAKAVAQKLKKAFNPPFVCLLSRGQAIPHTHILVFPSEPYGVLDGVVRSLDIFRSLLGELSPGKMEELANKIREA